MTSFLGKLFTSIALSISSLLGLHSAPQANTTPTRTAVFASSTTPISGSSVMSGIKLTSSPKPVAVQKATPVASTQSRVTSMQSQPITATPVVVQTPPPNTTLCNGTYWSECPSGEDFVCPATGSATCQVSAATQATQQAATTQQQASQAQSQQQAQLQPLENSFASDIQNINSECRGADAGGSVITCESAESELLPILQQEAQIGISVADAKPELTGLENAYDLLQTEYYASPGGVSEAYYEGTHNNIAAEMRILASDEAMFSN